jgi:curved DNA-binding protein CbpA
VKPSRRATHYDTLQVDAGASQDEVKNAYRRMAQKYHPDRHPGKDAAATVMARINCAYDILSDVKRRADYDSTLAGIDERQARNRARVAAMVPNVTGSTWALLFGIAALTFTTLGFVTLYSIAPRRVVSPLGVVSQPARTVETAPLAPISNWTDLDVRQYIERENIAPAIQPWKEPLPSANAAHTANDPVARLVREGVITPAPRSP